MAGTFRELSDEFNQAARDLPRGGKTPEIMLMRYALLLKHKAETDEEKAQLVETLYKCGVEMLRYYAVPNAPTWVGEVVPGNIKTVFDALSEPESLRHMPGKAPAELADIALELLTKADSADENKFTSRSRYDTYVKYMMIFSRTALQAADACRTEAAERVIDIKTSKSITPAKRIAFKKEGPEATP